MIRDTIDKAFEILGTLSQAKQTKMVANIEHALVGIGNLKTTYKDDATVVAQLDFLIEESRTNLTPQSSTSSQTPPHPPKKRE